jgi:hypothetical protein
MFGCNYKGSGVLWGMLGLHMIGLSGLGYVSLLDYSLAVGILHEEKYRNFETHETFIQMKFTQIKEQIYQLAMSIALTNAFQ